MAHSPAEQVSRNRSTSNGPSELPQHEHKRPRLDKDHTTASELQTSTEEIMVEAPQSRTVSPQAEPELPKSNTPPPQPNISGDPGVIVSPTSKVTINTRPLSAQSLCDATSDASPTNGDTKKEAAISTTSSSDSPVIISASDVGSTNDQPVQSMEPITIPSTPELEDNVGRIENGSPQEEAQVEPVFDVPSQWIWSSLPFMKTDTKEDVMHILDSVATVFENRTGPVFANTLSQITQWLCDALPTLELQTSETLLPDYELYKKVPPLMQGLLRRRASLSPSVSELDLVQFIKAYATLAWRLVRLDLQILPNVDDAASLDPMPWAWSFEYLRYLVLMLVPTPSCHLHTTLKAAGGVHEGQFSAMVAKALLDEAPIEPFRQILRLFELVAAKFPANSLHRTQLVGFANDFRVFLHASTSTLPALSTPKRSELDQLILSFVMLADATLQQAITKQHPWLTIENCENCFNTFSRLANIAIMYNSDVISYALEVAQVPEVSASFPENIELASEAYKLAILKRLVRHGRMELRVYGIETMATTFVEIWGRCHGVPQTRREALVKLVIDFLRHNEMVKYILSVDSHPQLVQRSSNVIGFLCVSHNWNPSDTDIAWQAILESEDRRSAAAVVEALKHNLEHLNIEALLYVLQTLQKTPFEKYDLRLFNFTLDVLRRIKFRNGQLSAPHPQVNVQVVELCLDLLRQSHTPSNICLDITEYTRQQLSELISRQGLACLGESERGQLFDAICIDISSHNDYATGSIVALSATLTLMDVLPAAELIASYDLVKLLLEDIVVLSKKQQSIDPAVATPQAEAEFGIRLSCIHSLLWKAPLAFAENLCKSFWVNILASNLPEAIRSRAWKALADAYGRANTTSPLLDYVSSRFIQDLSGADFGLAVLEFARACVDFETRHHVEDVSSIDEAFALPSLEKIWHIMLEANDEKVKTGAMKILVYSYLDSTALMKKSSLGAEKTHAWFVERCIQTVIQSARQLHALQSSGDEPSGDEDVSKLANTGDEAQRRIFRSLELLKSFLNTLKTRPRYKATASETIGPALATFVPRGEPLEVSIRTAGHPRMRDETLPWTIGQDNTGHEIWQFLTELMGWSQVYLVNAGNRLQLQDSQELMKNVKLGLGPISISKAMHTTDTGLPRAARASSPVDSRIMHHFNDLYDLLESQEPVAKAIYDFLTMFSFQETIVSKIKSMSLSAESLLPIMKPFKLLYYATALRACVEEESFSHMPNADFLRYALLIVTSTIQNVQSSTVEQRLRTTILKALIENLQLALKAKVDEATSAAYFPSHEAFVSGILQSWKSVQLLTSGNNDMLNRNFLDVILEATLHEKDLWQHLDNDSTFQHLITTALLLDENVDARQAVQGVISRLAGISDGKTLKVNDSRAARARFSQEKIILCLEHIWSLIQPLIPQCCEKPDSCRETLDSEMAVFSVVAKKLDESILLHLFADLKALLLAQHDPGRKIFCVNEYIPFGLAKLLSECMASLQAKSIPVPDTLDLITKLYQQFMFPPLSESGSALLAYQNVPLIEYDARTAVYDVILRAIQSPVAFRAILGEIEDGAVDRDAFYCNISNERKALRSDQGYCGLRNLSNTCYLNSLLSQLFMNLKFRELILDIEVVDPNKQKLVSELANVFANMQGSYEKYVNPEEAVDAITQYTGEPIDVTVQMDVDEFFNLLFDRLEAQIVDPVASNMFKTMYGGQLVQQIKSKECEHVSERVEPFSAVQIEIRGKSGLDEGLAAYVEGEVLQGDNKYSCTSCGRHVDAVKRACIKSMPDNLIFNLKRFDYDIMTGMRTKVNDEFEFPDEIDMAPYTIDALSNPETPVEPDVFELVGVIVHSGTAETGHYYSFVRQRPSPRAARDSWVQFNDSDVTRFDPSELRDQAFGGIDQTFTSLQKYYNGYMLFYQRSSSIRQYEKEFPILEQHKPVSVLLPKELDNAIALENEIVLRRYVAQDPAHAKFMRHIVERLRWNNESCSDSHEIENKLLTVALNYIQQVSSRWKELPEFEETIKLIVLYTQGCAQCALRVMQWFLVDRNIITTILRAWYAQVRRGFALLLTTCYRRLFPYRHAEHDLVPDFRSTVSKVLKKSINQIVEDWNQLQESVRGWDQLFSVLVAISNIGPKEIMFLVELNVLEKVAEVVWIHIGPNVKGTLKMVRQKYNTYLALREKNRTFQHGAAMELFARLISAIELDAQPLAKKPRLHPSDPEIALLQLREDGPFEWLRRLIHVGSSPNASELAVRTLCEYPRLAARTCKTLVNGVVQTPEYHAAARFVRPCLAFIAYTTNRKFAIEIINKTLVAIAETDGYCSGDYLDFVQTLAKLETTDSELDSDTIKTMLLQGMGKWAPMLLLAGNDIHRDVRGDTVIVLHEICFAQLEDAKVEDVRENETAMTLLRSLAAGCIDHATRNFLTFSQDGAQPRLAYACGQSRQIIEVLEEIEKYLDTGDAEADEQIMEIKDLVQKLQMLDSMMEEEQVNWEDNSDNLSDVEFSEESP